MIESQEKRTAEVMGKEKNEYSFVLDEKFLGNVTVSLIMEQCVGPEVNATGECEFVEEQDAVPGLINQARNKYRVQNLTCYSQMFERSTLVTIKLLIFDN